jgi:hypothetical protein
MASMTDINSKTTGKITIRGLFRDKFFLKGYADVSRERGWDAEYDKWYSGCQWNYERGRQYAAATANKMPPKVKTLSGKVVLSRDAQWAMGDLLRENAII